MTFNGDLSPLGAPQRVSGMRVPDSWALPGKPEGLSDAAEDPWPQTGSITCAISGIITRHVAQRADDRA